MDERFDRNERLIGADGQAKIANCRAGIAGLGGLGSPVAQQLAYLGVRTFVLVDADIVTTSSLNRLVGAVPSDADQRRPKVDVAKRLITTIAPDASVTTLPTRLEEAADAFDEVDVVFGCLDSELARLRLTAIAMGADKPYFDLASDIDPSVPTYGGRVFFSEPGLVCLNCAGVLDQHEIAVESMDTAQRQATRTMYGIDLDALGEAGPSVVSVNGVVASLAVTEFLAWVTGLRAPFRELRWYGHEGRLGKADVTIQPSCYYCRPRR